jgi:hypothetical protein
MVYVILVISLGRQTHCHSWSGRNDVYEQKFKWLRLGIKSSEARMMGWNDEKITESPLPKEQELSKKSIDENKYRRDTYQNGSNVIEPFDSSLNSDAEPSVVKESIMTRNLLDAGSFGELFASISELFHTSPAEWSFQQILLFLGCLLVANIFFSCCCAGTLCCCGRRRRGCGCGCCKNILLAFCCYEYFCGQNNDCDPCSGGDYVMSAGEYV